VPLVLGHRTHRVTLPRSTPPQAPFKGPTTKGSEGVGALLPRFP